MTDFAPAVRLDLVRVAALFIAALGLTNDAPAVTAESLSANGEERFSQAHSKPRSSHGSAPPSFTGAKTTRRH